MLFRSAATRLVYPDGELARAPKILGVDVARFGDDASVIFPRWGLRAETPMVFRHIDGKQGAGAVGRKAADWGAHAIFVDDTGGWGASWIDQLRVMNHNPIPVGFASSPIDPRYDNKRTEMYFRAVEWIKSGGALPAECPDLIAALSQTTYSYRGDRLLLEPKEQVKQRLGFSPDEADAFALTFAQDVAALRLPGDRSEPARRFCVMDFDPLDRNWREKARRAGHYLVD